MTTRIRKAYEAHYMGRKMPEILEDELLPGRARWRKYQ